MDTSRDTPGNAPITPLSSVYFDCDSTLSTIEGVDELLRYADPSLRADVLKLTAQAMEGNVPLAEVYATRLQKLRPRRDQLDAVGQHYIDHLVADTAATIRALQALGKHVGIVSGGLLAPVRHLAEHLGVPAVSVHAVPLLFDEAGNYVDFDRNSPLWKNGGKIDVVKAAPATHHPMAFVGDGVTDLETKASVARFIGFGGVEQRQAVRDGADYYTDRASLAAILPFVLTQAEQARLAASGQDELHGEDFTSLLSDAEA